MRKFLRAASASVGSGAWRGAGAGVGAGVWVGVEGGSGGRIPGGGAGLAGLAEEEAQLLEAGVEGVLGGHGGGQLGVGVWASGRLVAVVDVGAALQNAALPSCVEPIGGGPSKHPKS